MIRKIAHQGVTWIDVTSPTKDELSSLAKEFDLHPLLSTELGAPSVRSKVDVYEDYIYLILHFPNCEACYGVTPSADPKEIDFIVGKNFLITTHYEPVEALDEFAQIMEAGPNSYRAAGKTHAGHLLFAIARRLYQSLEEGLLYLNGNLKSVEKKVFAGHEKEMVKILADINHSLLDFHWSLKNHQEILTSFEMAGKEFFGPSFTYYLRAMLGEYEKIWNMLQSNREAFTDLRQINESLLTIKTNEIMKFFTVMAFVTLPLTVLTQMFGMNSDYLPIVGHPQGFWIILILMGISVATIFIFFRLKKWL